jgi:hypothetical protein
MQPPLDLARRVLRRSETRRRLRRVLGVSGAAAALVLAVSLSVLFRGGGSEEQRLSVMPADDKPQLDVATIKQELARLDCEAASRVAVARRLADLRGQDQRAGAMELPPAPLDPVLKAQLEAERAARVLVMHAARLERELHAREPAMESYRTAIRFFPKTPWAQVARQRLSLLEQQNVGDKS